MGMGNAGSHGHGATVIGKSSEGSRCGRGGVHGWRIRAVAGTGAPPGLPPYAVDRFSPIAARPDLSMIKNPARRPVCRVNRLSSLLGKRV